MAFNISNIDYLIYQKLEFEIFKVFNIWLQRYWDYKIRVCGNDSIPFYNIKRLNVQGTLRSSSIKIVNIFFCIYIS